MDWNFALAAATQVITLACLGAVVWTRLSVLERDHQELKTEVRDFRQLREDIAVVKSQLVSINDVLHKYVDEAVRNN